jgi:drug/metabolite transporter (DMT)-like permease
MKWPMIAVIIFCTVASDVLQSFEMKRSGAAGEIRKSAAAVIKPLLILSIVLLAVAFFAYLQVLRVAGVSFVAAVTASTYVFDGLLAKFLLKEHLNSKRWLGIGFICAGVILVSIE